MELTNKERFWHKKYYKEAGKIQELIKDFKSIDPYSKEGIKQSKDSAKEHGRAWWIFAGIEFRHNRKEKTWIEQFYKGKDEDGVKK